MSTSDLLIDLDNPARKATVIVRYRGVVIPITKERLLELLGREEDYFNLRAEAGGDGPAPRPVAVDASHHHQAPARIPADAVTHARLSMRIKRVYGYSVSSRELRPTHADVLADAIDHFDWKVPEHPNTQLDFQLKDILTWKGVSEPLRARVERFLARYCEIRYGKVG